MLNMTEDSINVHRVENMVLMGTHAFSRTWSRPGLISKVTHTHTHTLQVLYFRWADCY